MTSTKVQIVLLSLFYLSYACDDAKPIKELQRRGRNYIYDDNEPVVNDLLLNEGWYTVSDIRGQYKMPDSSVRPPLNGCGTLNQIYIKETHPEVPSDVEINIVTCVQTIFSECASEILIAIRKCGNEIQYYLPITNRNQAYCFDPPRIQGEIDFPEPPENFHPGIVRIAPNLRWTIHATNNYNQPFLFFECSFSKTNGLFYTVSWYVDGKIEFVKGPTIDIEELRLETNELVLKGYHLGINVQCGVRASVDKTGSLTKSSFSSEFFAGIKVINASIVVNAALGETLVQFSPTVPIGCYHLEGSTSCGERKLFVNMKNPDNDCYESLAFQRCSKAIELLTKDEPWTPGTIYDFKATSNFKILEPTTHDLYLETDSGFEDEFFAGQDLQRILVTVGTNNTHWNPRRCYSHVDPHMKTFDGVTYENQRSGDYILYRNMEYRIEVQERTQNCINSAVCTCQVAIRAGGDVFVMNRCPGTTQFNEFRSCNDRGILDVVKVNGNIYKIYTPTGTVVQVTVVYNGQFMNVDIYSSPKDLNNVEGLCGLYDDNNTNDFRKSDGLQAAYKNTDYEFSESWRVKPMEGLLTGYSLEYVENWASTNAMMCVCKQSGEFLEEGATPAYVDEAYCDMLENDECTYNASVTEKKCNKILLSKRRSLSQHTFIQELFLKTAHQVEISRRQRRSPDSNPMTEAEIREYCSDIIRNSQSVKKFPERLMGENIDDVIENCVFDVMETGGDLSVGEIHVRSLDNVVKQTFTYEPTFVASNTETIKSFLRETCPNNCNGKGVCSEDGECLCENLYHGPECNLFEGDPINVDLIEGHGVCDTALGDDCRCHWFYTNNLLEDFSCKFRRFKVGINESKTYMDEVILPGEYDDMFTGQCCLPETRNKRSVESDGLGYEWEVAISNDGTHFGTGQTLYTIDQTCVDAVTNSSTNKRSLILKDGYCIINFQCVADSETMISNKCQSCSVHMDKFGWTYVCTVSNEASDPTGKIAGIASGVAAATVVAIVVVIWVIYKLTQNKRMVYTEMMLDLRNHKPQLDISAIVHYDKSNNQMKMF